MNREICFRGKRIDNGEWVYGLPFAVYANLRIDGIETYDGERHGVDPATVGQFAGWHDRHGSNVFEGDIVNGFSIPHNQKETYYVMWTCNNGFYLIDNCGVKWNPKQVASHEIIGNIHDHLSLLRW